MNKVIHQMGWRGAREMAATAAREREVNPGARRRNVDLRSRVSDKI